MGATQLTASNGEARLEGELTFSTVTNLFDRMKDLGGKNELPASIDLSGITAIDSSGLALLLEWQAAYNRQSGNWISYRNPPDALMKIARLCDAESFLSACENGGMTTGENP